MNGNAEICRIGSATELEHINASFTIKAGFCFKWLICINHTNMTRMLAVAATVQSPLALGSTSSVQICEQDARHAFGILNQSQRNRSAFARVSSPRVK